MTQQNLFDEPRDEPNPCPVSYPHQPHDYCDGKPSAKPLGTVYNAEESERRKEEGMKQAADAHPAPLALAKEIAVRLATIHGETHADAVGKVLERDHGVHLGPEAGSLFKGKMWEFTGKRVRSTKESNHGREIRVWRLKTQ